MKSLLRTLIAWALPESSTINQLSADTTRLSRQLHDQALLVKHLSTLTMQLLRRLDEVEEIATRPADYQLSQRIALIECLVRTDLVVDTDTHAAAMDLALKLRAQGRIVKA